MQKLGFQIFTASFKSYFIDEKGNSILFCSFSGHLSPPGPYKRYNSPPRRPRSPRGPNIRFEQNRFEQNNRNKFQRRGDSAPRANPTEGSEEQQSQRNARDGDERSKNDISENLDASSKSKSLPPVAKNVRQSGREMREAEEKKKEEEKAEEKRLEFEERLKRLPTPGTVNVQLPNQFS